MPNELLVTLSHHSADACWYLAAALHPERVPSAREAPSLVDHRR